jgi:molybdopterin-guanine dinucleotide biosynthesis protein A
MPGRKKHHQAVEESEKLSTQMENGISGVILAGGDNKRFGGILKSNTIIGGETIISRIIGTVRDLFNEIIIVTNTPAEFRECIHCKIVKDEFLKAGPLGGIHAAMKSAVNEAIFVFAGDMPLLDKRLIVGQIDAFNMGNFDILVPRIGRNIEPLHAIYRKSLLNDLEIFITGGKNRPVRDFISAAKVSYFDLQESEESKRAFTNINSPEDISRII